MLRATITNKWPHWTHPQRQKPLQLPSLQIPIPILTVITIIIIISPLQTSAQQPQTVFHRHHHQTLRMRFPQHNQPTTSQPPLQTARRCQQRRSPLKLHTQYQRQHIIFMPLQQHHIHNTNNTTTKCLVASKTSKRNSNSRIPDMAPNATRTRSLLLLIHNTRRLL